jgi:MFS family permease
MNAWKRWRYLFFCMVVIIVVLIATSLLDILLAVLFSRFYTQVLFVVTFGVGGVFAAVLGYMYGIESAPEKNESARWSLITLMIAAGVLFFFLFSEQEGGEYKPAFKAFGVTLALGSLLFMKGKVD